MPRLMGANMLEYDVGSTFAVIATLIRVYDLTVYWIKV